MLSGRLLYSGGLLRHKFLTFGSYARAGWYSRPKQSQNVFRKLLKSLCFSDGFDRCVGFSLICPIWIVGYLIRTQQPLPYPLFALPSLIGWAGRFGEWAKSFGCCRSAIGLSSRLWTHNPDGNKPAWALIRRLWSARGTWKYHWQLFDSLSYYNPASLYLSRKYQFCTPHISISFTINYFLVLSLSYPINNNHSEMNY